MAQRTSGDEAKAAELHKVENLPESQVKYCARGHRRRKSAGEQCGVCARDTMRARAGLPPWEQRTPGDLARLRQVEEGCKSCRWCHKAKPLSDFRLDAPIELHSDSCSSCRLQRGSVLNRKKPLRVVYLTAAQRKALLDHYGRRCVVCGAQEKDLAKPLTIDHCHKTDKIRGVLCNRHNLTLGLIRDDPRELDLLRNYLSDPWSTLR